MEIKINVNEAEILKHLMDGLDAKSIANNIRPRIIQSLQYKIESKVSEEITKQGIDVSKKIISKELIPSCKSIITKQIKKYMNEDSFELDDIISSCVYDILATSLDGKSLTIKI